MSASGCNRGCPEGECYCGDLSMDYGEAYGRCPHGQIMWDGGCYCKEDDREPTLGESSGMPAWEW